MMILLLSTANELYWLGRHSERLYQLEAIAQPASDEEAQQIAYAYGWDVSLCHANMADYIQTKIIPDIILAIENNVQNVRGVIDQDTFELFNLVKRLQASGSYRAATLQLYACTAAMKHQEETVMLFWEIGRRVEEVDNLLRLNKSAEKASQNLQRLLAELPKNTRWRELDKFCSQLMRRQEYSAFYRFNEQFDELIAEGV